MDQLAANAIVLDDVQAVDNEGSNPSLLCFLSFTPTGGKRLFDLYYLAEYNICVTIRLCSGIVKG